MPNPRTSITNSNFAWSPTTRRVSSVLIALHVAAVFIAPWSAPRPASLLAERLAYVLSPYLQATYINHGYRFFAPNPGPSHIVRYELTRTDGTTIRGIIPDPERHRPRLLYHRYFMMTESLFRFWSSVRQLPAEEGLPEPDREQIISQNNAAKSMADHLARGLALELLRIHQGATVKLVLQEHEIPFPLDVENGKRLNAPDLYRDLVELGEFKQEETGP